MSGKSEGGVAPKKEFFLPEAALRFYLDNP